MKGHRWLVRGNWWSGQGRVFERMPLLAVIAVLFVPHIFSYKEAKTPLNLGLPRVHAGDEPHYLIFINSLLYDGDLKLGNNYESALRGSLQAGMRYQGRVIDHHSAWYENGERHHWRHYYQINPWAGKTELKQGLVPPEEYVERPHNVPGLAILLAPLLWPIKGTGYLEPTAILFSGCAMALAAAFFYGIVRWFTESRFVAVWVTGLTFLGTPLWHYGRTLFPEAYLPALLLGALYFHFVSPRSVVAGLLLGVGLFIKPPFALTAIPLLVERIFRKEWGDLSRFAGPLGLGVVAYIGTNLFIYGRPMPSRSIWSWGPLSRLGSTNGSSGTMGCCPLRRLPWLLLGVGAGLGRQTDVSRGSSWACF